MFKIKKKYLLILPICLLPGIILATIIYFAKIDRPRQKLFTAIKNGDIASVNKILSKENSIINTVRESLTPLHEAASYKRSEIARILIHRGSDVNAKGGRHNFLPLHVSAARGDIKTMTLLLDSGALINAKDDVGETPLMTAAATGHTKAVELLLDRGAKINLKSNFFPHTALDYAVEFCHPAIVETLIDHGAKNNFEGLIRLVETKVDGLSNIRKRNNYLKIIKILREGKKLGDGSQ